LKIFDSSFLIAILSDIDCPQIIEDLIQLKHKLVIPYCVCHEVICGSSGKLLQKLINDNKFEVLQLNIIEEIEDLQITYPYLGIGELDSLLTYDKLLDGNNSIHCVLDDKSARKVAKDRKVSHTGTIGLLRLMENRKIISNQNYKEIIDSLKSSGFRIPKEIC